MSVGIKIYSFLYSYIFFFVVELPFLLVDLSFGRMKFKSSAALATLREFVVGVISLCAAFVSGAVAVHLRRSAQFRRLKMVRLPALRRELAEATARRHALEMELLALDPSLSHPLTASIARRYRAPYQQQLYDEALESVNECARVGIVGHIDSSSSNDFHSSKLTC